MLNRTSLISVLLFAILPFISVAQDSPPQSQVETIDKIIAATSVEEELHSPIEELQTQFSQNPFGLPSDQNEQMMEVYTETFKPDETIKTIRGTFSERYNEEHAKAVLKWLEKETTQQVLEYEKEFYTLQGIRKRIVSKYELEQNPPNQDRQQLLQSLAKTLSAPETEIEARVTIFRAMVNAFSTLSNQQTFGSRQVDTFANNFRNQIRPQIDQQVVNQFLVKYHGLDAAALKEYSSFFSTEAGKWLANTTSQSIDAALKESSDRFLSDIKASN